MREATNLVRIAMWSGPRNISTAMMRAWGNRSDTIVCDEPLYAHYLLHHPVDHPGVPEVLERHETDLGRIIAWLTGGIPGGKRIFYQKHMAHHLLDHIERGWLDRLTHAFLIREPREMLTSLAQKMPSPSLDDTGLPQQVEIFRWVRERSGSIPPVLDARDVLEDPRRTLNLLCERLGVPFEESMLTWPPGRRDTDGVWAKHWYENVEKSTSFQPFRPKPEEVPGHLRDVLRECDELYEELHRERIT